jgi:hypothetical protein
MGGKMNAGAQERPADEPEHKPDPESMVCDSRAFVTYDGDLEAGDYCNPHVVIVDRLRGMFLPVKVVERRFITLYYADVPGFGLVRLLPFSDWN